MTDDLKDALIRQARVKAEIEKFKAGPVWAFIYALARQHSQHARDKLVSLEDVTDLKTIIRLQGEATLYITLEQWLDRAIARGAAADFDLAQIEKVERETAAQDEQAG